MPYLCPTCDGELLIDDSAPRNGTPCPLCRAPLPFLRTPTDDGIVLTFLSTGKRLAADFAFNSTLRSDVQTATAVVADLSRLKTVSSTTLETLKMLHERLVSTGGRMSILAVHPEVIRSIKKAGMEVGVADSLHRPAESGSVPVRYASIGATSTLPVVLPIQTSGTEASTLV